MQLNIATLTALASVLALSGVQAKSLSHTPGVCYHPGPECTPYTPPDFIQDSECAFNKRTGKLPQTFAVWQHNPAFDKSHGAPYGKCIAYTCPVAANIKKKFDPGCRTLFWTSATAGAKPGPGTDCVRSPVNNNCGCETSDGKFHEGRDDCWKDPGVGK
ncbi:hypothetical protein C1H76_8919 [Elsinoe australis]|uniref:Uncharacterized protein n=1 Tax=Elsinoe australis TaxID=40998 RepID=A0A4U7AMI2_9PEZI|nr:hypothetical protein C1H76_8919 [Elsinoe australis]